MPEIYKNTLPATLRGYKGYAACGNVDDRKFLERLLTVMRSELLESKKKRKCR